jgi:tetratricopeptide (TPR) repeat protein
MGQRPGNNQNHDPLDPQASLRERFRVWAVCGLLVLMVLLVFGQACQFEFTVCDDDPYVYGNPHVIEGFSPGAWRSWEDNPLYWSLTTCTAGNWHPLTWMSHIIDGQLYGVHDTYRFFGPDAPERWRGPEAGWHHLTSVLLHAAAAVVLFLALRRLTAAFWCSALVAAMFALHPLRAESVAWVAERKDVLSGLFWMLTLWAYGGYVRRPLYISGGYDGRPNIGWYFATVCLLALGLMAKSMLVTLPCVLLLLDVWPLRRWQPKLLYPALVKSSPPQCAPQPLWALLVEKIPLFLLSGIVSRVVAQGQQSMGCMSMTDNVTMPYRIYNAAFSAAAYLWKLIWPIDLSQSFHQGRLVCKMAIFYPHLAVMGDEAKARLVWYGIGGGLVVAAITVLAIWNLRRRPYLAVGWFWYLGGLVPVIGLIQVGAQGMADRYTYIPMIGVYIMIVWGGAELAARLPHLRTALGVAAGVVLAAWMALTVAQVATWENSETVFQHAVDVTSDNYFAYNHLGLAYQYGNFPDHMEKAREAFVKAVEYGPSYDAANANLGVSYMNRKRPDQALACFKRASAVNPYAAFHYANLAGAYFGLNRYTDAAAELEKAIKIEPTSPRYHQSMALALLRLQKPKRAIAELDEVLRLSPNDVATMRDVAFFLATSTDASVRDGKRALQLAQAANKLTRGNDPISLYTLAAAYAETGRYEEAVDIASEAIRLAMQYNNPGLANTIRDMRRVFASGQPLRVPLPAPPTNLAPSR